jgi:hypothetical protein
MNSDCLMCRNLRVGASVGHGELEGLVVPQLEVLVGELLAELSACVDGFAASALDSQRIAQSVFGHCNQKRQGRGVVGARCTHVATSEVTTLEHELRNNAVEDRSLVALTLGSLRKLAEVFGSPRDNVVKEVEDDAAGLGYNMARQLSARTLTSNCAVDMA